MPPPLQSQVARQGRARRALSRRRPKPNEKENSNNGDGVKRRWVNSPMLLDRIGALRGRLLRCDLKRSALKRSLRKDLTSADTDPDLKDRQPSGPATRTSSIAHSADKHCAFEWADA